MLLRKWVIAFAVVSLCLITHGCAVTILDGTNLKGPSGSKYWDITQPGSYSVAITQLSTNANYAIKISSSDVFLDGNGLLITGPAIPSGPTGGSAYGILVLGGENITIQDFTISKKYYGLYFNDVDDGSVDGISFSSNLYGIQSSLTTGSTFSDCIFSQNSGGFQSDCAHDDVVQDCEFTSNTNGFYVQNAVNMEISGSEFTQNQNVAIWLQNCTGTHIFNNRICQTGYVGIYLGSSSNNNVIYNNFWQNTDNEELDSTIQSNQWNIPPVPGENIIGGSTVCGNYWNNEMDTGFSEMTLDVNGDGICDDPYVIKNGNVDGYALHQDAEQKFLDESNVKGTTGYQYWDITAPGIYRLAISSPTFSTSNNYAIRIFCSNVVLDGNGKTITGPYAPSTPSESGPSVYGVRVNCGAACQNVTVRNMTVSKKYYGVIYEAVDGGRVEDVSALQNVDGIYLWDCEHLTLSENTASSNKNGIVLDAYTAHCQYNTIDHNTLGSNSDFGILLWLACNHNSITNNHALNNEMGIVLTNGGLNNTVLSNTVEGNVNGIFLSQYSGNTVSGNSLDGNTNVGLWLESSSTNTCSGNYVNNSGWVGIYIGSSSNSNTVVNNFFKNIDNEQSDGTNSNTRFSTTPTTGPNIVGGPGIGGNFWTNPSGTGFSDTTPDANADGFCDTAYNGGNGILDSYPLHRMVILGAEVVSNTIPATMTPGQSYNVAVTMRNSGTSTWSTASGEQLGGVGDWTGDAAKFGPLRVALPAGTTVAPGQTHTFTFTMTAPTATGTYYPAYRMVAPSQWFGQTLSKTITVGSAGQPDAEVVSDTIPATMTPGQSYNVAVTMRNSGTSTWSTGNGEQLGGVGDWTGDAAKFGPLRVALPAGTTVAPGQTHTFTFTMTAPTATGTYHPEYRMVAPSQWFGQTLSTTITVGSAGIPDAEVVSDTIPATMTPGQSYNVAVTMRNSGTSMWSTANGEQLGGVGDWTGDAAKFGPLRVALPAGTTVAPGQTHTFTFTMTAPTATGTYHPAYQMVCPTQWFGQTLSKTVTVSTGGSYNAEVVASYIPATMIHGRTYSVYVTMKNTGTTTWSGADGISLGGVGDESGDAAKFGPTRIPLPAGTTVAPGKTYRFLFTMTAPAATGTYNPQYQMVYQTQWFGGILSKTVTVK